MTAATGASLLPWLALALALAAAALIAGLLIYAHRARSAGAQPGPPGDGLDRSLLRQLRHEVRRALGWVATLTGSAEGRYDIPWVVLLGFAGSRAGALAAGLTLPGDIDEDDRPELGKIAAHTCRDGLLLRLPEDLLEQPDWRSQWRSLLHSLAVERPERPLDGVAVAIAVADLVGPGSLSTAQLSARGEQLQELLWAVQRRTGFRVPVYLVLSGAEALAGFSAWVRAVPEAGRDGLLGCPPPDQGDGPIGERLARTLDQLAGRLGSLQLPLLMRGAEPAVVDGLLLLPGELERLQGPLGVLLGPCLRPSAYQDGTLFRGCYLIGDELDGAPGFARGLFGRKIFAERGLAEPARGALGRRRQQIRLAQAGLAALLLLGAIGLVRVAAKLEGADSVTMLLRAIDGEVSRVERAAGDGEAALDGIRAVAAGNLLERMSDLSVSSLETVKAPTSLLSDTDDRVERAIAVGYDVILLQAIHARLLAQFDDLIELVGGTAPTPAAMADGLRRLQEHEANLRRYERLDELDVQALAGVAHYALGISVPPSFYRHYGLYQHALADTAPAPIDRAELSDRIGRALMEGWTGMVDAHDRVSPVAVAMGRAQAPPAADLDPVTRLHVAAEAVDRLARALERPESAWLAAPGELDATLEGLLTEVRDVAAAWGPPLDPTRLSAQLRAIALERQAAERERLMTARLFGVAPALVGTDQGLGLAPPLARARAALTTYLDQPLLREGDSGAVAMPGRSGQRLVWDTAQLRELIAAAEGALVADQRDLAGLPPELARMAREAGTPALAALVNVALRRARASDANLAWSADHGLEREARAFAAAEPMLTSLTQTLELAGLRDRAAALQATLVEQTRRLLAEVDATLQRGAPYAMLDPGLGSWDGETPLRVVAYGTSSSADLAASLPGRRAFVERLATDYARPLLGVLSHSRAGLDVEDEARIARWEATIEALDRAQRGDPASSLTRLERFLTTGLDAVGPTSCEAGAADRAIGLDYFADQLYALQEAVAQRCVVLAAMAAAERYGRLAAVFNTALAGRFPFTAAGAAAATAPRAAPDEVRRFFREHDAELAALSQALGPVLPPGVPEAAPAFLAELTAARVLLAPMLDPPVPAPLSYEIEAEFRAEPSQDRGGNQVLEWALETPAGRLSSLGGAGPLSWTAGQPVRLVLRWARNAPSLPVARTDGLPRVEGPLAVFEYRDPWALLTLLRVHAAPATADGGAFATLAFSVPLAPNPDAAVGGTGLDQALLFTRLRLTAVTSVPGEPARRTPLLAPRLPAVAPEAGQAMAIAAPGPRRLTVAPAAGP